MADGFQRAAVIGSGTMGTGISQCLADCGLDVALCDLNDDLLARSLDRMAAARRFLVEAGRLDVAAAEVAATRVRTTTSLDDAMADIDLVVEAVPENLELKCDLLGRLDTLCAPHVPFASNTSGLSITRLGDATGRPELVAGFHWWNPAHLTPLVEVVSGERTDAAVIERLMSLARLAGKRPIYVRRDVPGFVGNRLQFAVFREAMHLVGEGIVSPEDLDAAMTGGPGFRWGFLGPLRTADFGGLDVFLSIAEYLWPELSHANEPPAALRELIESGRLGVKTGAGFYDYADDEIDDWTKRRDEFFVRLSEAIGTTSAG